MTISAAAESEPRLITSTFWNTVCIIAGPLLGCFIAWVLPSEFRVATGEFESVGLPIRATLGTLAWMATWWLTQCLPLWLTALIPLLVFPITQTESTKVVCLAYVDPTIRLFLGGFLISAAIARWGLGERLSLLVLRAAGTRPRNLVGGLMLVTALLSAFVSNAATAAIMLPIAVSLIGLVRAQYPEHPEAASGFGTSCMLGVAYAASLGGLITLLGSPPNLLLAGFLKNLAAPNEPLQVSFLGWLGIGLPFAGILLPVFWWFLTQRMFPLPNEAIPGAGAAVRSRLERLGSLNPGEIATLCTFTLAVFLWIASPWLKPLGIAGVQPLKWLSDWRIGALAVALLLVWPVSFRPLTFALELPDFRRVPWSVLVLFGGGLALSAAMTESHADRMLAAGLSFFESWPRPLAVLMFVIGIIFFTEIASNTATVATALPVFGALAEAWQIHPVYLAVPITIAASCAFMLPVGTPPNAIVFATGLVSGRDMIRAGWWLNWICVVAVGLLSNQLIEWFLM